MCAIGFIRFVEVTKAAIWIAAILLLAVTKFTDRGKDDDAKSDKNSLD